MTVNNTFSLNFIRITYLMLSFGISLNYALSTADFRVLNRHKRNIEYGLDIAGPYCATRRDGGCCDGRKDVCSVPILDTLCYCDQFCNRTRSDCCPDYFSFCYGASLTSPPPPKACSHQGRTYVPNAEVKINCNKCQCTLNQRSATGFDWLCDKEVCLVREAIINRVNNANFGWKASNYSKFWGMALKEGRQYRLGTNKPDNHVLNMTPIASNYDHYSNNFDARVKWPGLIHDVSDQGNCASSWAFSTTATASDRLAIESGGAANYRLSPQDLMACNHDGQGCNGGSLDRAWWHLRKRGVTTEDCYPYTSNSTGKAGQCLIKHQQTNVNCPSGILFKTQNVFHATPPYRISKTEGDIMTEIFTYGPVQATFKVKDDFFLYRSGVYKYSAVVPETSSVSEEKDLYHSVRIIGWGEERINGRNITYWICVNSWGKDWGEGGYFRIVRGTNECEIEMFILGSWSKTDRDDGLRTLLDEYRQKRLFQSSSQSRRHFHGNHARNSRRKY